MKTPTKICMFVLSLFVLVAGPSCSDAGLFNKALEQDTVRILKNDGTEYLFHVELADEPHEQERGLMMRKYMAENAGMLFLFKTEGKRTFWMKDTLIPLDMLFISRDGTIHHIHRKAQPQYLTHITSERPAMAVLEIGGGLSDKYGIKEGDKVLHAAFRNLHIQ